ncbi:MAG: methionine--tRNA ligase, partial [Christensenellaceae bacterium]|nr:methionine--tRNA ligase [Christensenellaceae bacterium]
MSEKYFITTPRYYPSGKWHIGTCYTTVVCDALAEFKRKDGAEVFYLTGTDEHGQKIERIAAEKGVAIKDFLDERVGALKALWQKLGIKYDKFIRTTDGYHEKAVQKIFEQLYAQGDIYKSEYEGWYCTPCESFWTESQLKDGKCPDCGRAVEKAKEESYFFRLSKYQDKIINLIKENPEWLLPVPRQNEMLNNFLLPGLTDLSVTRTSFKWGIEVPFDKKHIVYVWVDALANYITALGYKGEDDLDFKKYWAATETHGEFAFAPVVHLMGKEIIRFHSIVWPALLLALGIPLPKKVYGHGWLLFGEDKVSKSKGNTVDPVVLSDKYSVDALRYFLLREVPFGSDGEYTNRAFLTRRNADLCNTLGNLLSRTAAMLMQYFGGAVPSYAAQKTGIHSELAVQANELFPKLREYIDKLLVPEALNEIFKLLSRANKYIDETTPWLLAKDPAKRDELALVLYNLAETLRISALALSPFLPDTAQRIFDTFGLKAPKFFAKNDKFGVLKPGTSVVIGEKLYDRIDIDKELALLDTENAAKEVKPAPKKEAKVIENKPEIAFGDFAKCDFRIGVVKACEKVAKSDKLLKFNIDFGTEERVI